MNRHKIVIALLAPLMLSGAVGGANATTPKLYVYEGAGCTGLAKLPDFEGMIGRKVDGVVDFNDYSQSPSNALSNLDWQLGCWRGRVPNIAISIGLGFNGMSTAQIADGGMDVIYARMGASLVGHGFANAYIRLGWEENGGWYSWGQKGSTFATAFDRVARIFKATPGAKFTILYNPAGGLEMDKELPSQEDMMAVDEYANTWNSGGVRTEPGLWQGNLKGWWGFDTLGSWPKSSLPTAIPEFGVGSRADGHGACPDTGAGACDDPVFMASGLAQAEKIGASFFGYWDYDAGDYNAMISDGSRPLEAGEFIRVYAGPGLRAVLAVRAGPYAASTPPTLTCIGCHAAPIQTGPDHWDVVVWAREDHPNAKLTWSGKILASEVYDPSIGTKPRVVLGAASSATLVLKANKPLIVSVQQ